jgi:hypothetical protein
VHQLLVGFFYLEKRGAAPHRLNGSEAALDRNNSRAIEKLVAVKGYLLHQVLGFFRPHFAVLNDALVVAIE